MRKIARILKANGTQGALLLSAPEVELEEIKEPVWVVFDSLPVPFFILSCERKGSGRYIVTLNDVENLEDAEEMTGKDVFLDSPGEDDVRDAASFSGWTLQNRGETVGEITDTDPIPGNPCVYVSTPGGEKMIPLHEDLVISLDKKNRIINLDLPEGLI